MTLTWKNFFSALLALMTAATIVSIGNGFFVEWISGRGWYGATNTPETNFPFRLDSETISMMIGSFRGKMIGACVVCAALAFIAVSIGLETWWKRLIVAGTDLLFFPFDLGVFSPMTRHVYKAWIVDIGFHLIVVALFYVALSLLVRLDRRRHWGMWTCDTSPEAESTSHA